MTSRPPPHRDIGGFAAAPYAAPLHDACYLDDELLDGPGGGAVERAAAAFARRVLGDLLAQEGARRLARLAGADPAIEAWPWRR